MTTDDIEVRPLAGELRFRDPAGRLRTWTVRYGPDPVARDCGVLSRMLTTSDGVSAVRRWVPAELVARQPDACQVLENEVRAGMRLFHRYGSPGPDELTRLLGYDLDGAEPFVLLAPERGRPVAELDPLLLDERAAFQVSLLRAVLLLGAAGVVHGNLTARTVRWDGSAVWLGDCGRAAVAGEASPADDVLAAGTLISWMADRRGDPTDLAHRGPALRSLLDGVFAADPEARPPVTELLRRLGADTTVPPADPVLARAFEQGRAEFERVLARKWPPEPPAAPPVPVPRRLRVFRRPDWFARFDPRGDVAAVAIVVALAAVLTLLVLWRPW